MIDPTKFAKTRACLLALHAALADEDASYEVETEYAAMDHKSDLDDYQDVQIAMMIERLADSEHRPMFDLMRIQVRGHIEFNKGLEEINDGD